MPDVDDAGPRCGRCHTPVAADDAFCPECGLSLRPSLDLPGFSAVRLLGSGGAADVFLARQDELDREVAVKLLRSGIDDERSWRAFSHEARTVAKLSGHPNVVAVYTAGSTASGRHYLVTEYLDQGSLDDVIAADGPLPPAIVARIGVAIADALMAAHGLGIHHRDVKPANVLLGSGGRIKLADFGIARLLAGHSVTTTDVMAFTPEHVAPEVLRSEPDGPWSDLYGLASTLATALLGAPPLRRAPDERMETYLTRKLMAPPPDLPADVPVELAAPIEAALAPRPDDRPPLPKFRAAMADAVRRLGLAGAGSQPTQAFPAHPAVVAPPVGPPTPLLDRRRLVTERRRGRVALLALITLGLVGGAVAAMVLGGDDETATGSTGPSNPASTSVSSLAPGVASTTPVTTAAPVATPAPTQPTPTLAPTTLTATPVTLPPNTQPPDTRPSDPASDVIADADQAEAFMADYYSRVNDGDYEVTWDLLAPEFKEQRNLEYDEYVDFWNDNDIEVTDVDFVSSDAQTAIVRVELRWNGRGPRQTDEFVLRRADADEADDDDEGDGDGQGLLIVRQASV
jgi:hypothetical protein